jgi:hypothetical protein
MDLETFILSTPGRQPLFARSMRANPNVMSVYQGSIGNFLPKSDG